jgi:Etoposide-induced protein 2.4 (EI24)
MPASLSAFLKAILSQCHPRMLALLVLPIVVSLLVAVIVGVLAWTPISLWVGNHMLDSGTYVGKAYQWASGLGLGGLKDVVLVAMILLIFTPLAFVLGLAATAAIAMPTVARFLGGGGYKDVHLEGSFSLAASLANSLKALGIFFVVYLISIPLWFIPVVGLMVPWLCWSWLTARIMRFDSLLEHATGAERALLIKTNRPQYFMLGMMISSLNFFPLMILVTPVLCALAYGHFSLKALRDLRASGFKSPIRVS